jgi:hypothetical protein
LRRSRGRRNVLASGHEHAPARARAQQPGEPAITVNKLPVTFEVDSMTSGGKTDVLIAGIGASFAITACSGTVKGSVPGYFNNKTRVLTLTPAPPFPPREEAQLTISQVHGCAGIVNNGDHPTHTAKGKLGHLVIESA